jgi:hypothetical protein
VAVVLVTLVAVVAAGAAIAVVATRGGTGTSSPAHTPRIALVVPLSSEGTADLSAPYQAAPERARSTYGVRTQTFAIDLSKP